MTDTRIQAAFLIAARYGVLYERYAPRYANTDDVYAIPRIDRDWTVSRIKYRGMDRDALGADRSPTASNAEAFLHDLEQAGRSVDGLVIDADDVRETFRWLDHQADQFEVIWARTSASEIEPPDRFVSLGFEPSYFDSDHFSPSCDCMLIPRWHGTDREGTRFAEHFDRLNRHGLFESPDHARTFLADYVSLDWTENGDEYDIVEVFVPADAMRA